MKAETPTDGGIIEHDKAPRIIKPLDAVATSIILILNEYRLDISRLEIFAESGQGEDSSRVHCLLTREDAADARSGGRGHSTDWGRSVG